MTCHIFRPIIDMVDPKFVLGMEFRSKNMLTETRRRHRILHKKRISFKMLYKTQFTVKCVSSSSCKWYLYIVRFNKVETFKIKTNFVEHDCPNVK